MWERSGLWTTHTLTWLGSKHSRPATNDELDGVVASYRKLGLEVGLLRHELVLLVVEVGNGAGFGLEAVEEIFLLLVQLGQVGLELLAEFLLLLEVGLGGGGLVFKSLDLILDAGDVEQRLDLLPQTVPGPGAHLQVAAQVALDNAQGDTANRILKGFEWPGKNGWMDNLPLVLQLLVLLAGVVSADEGLHPGDDLGQFVISHLLKLTQDSGLEEDLWFFVWFCTGAETKN